MENYWKIVSAGDEDGLDGRGVLGRIFWLILGAKFVIGAIYSAPIVMWIGYSWVAPFPKASGSINLHPIARKSNYHFPPLKNYQHF